MLTRTELAYSAIKTRILRLEMPPGSSFTAVELAGELGTSKTPIREALSKLEREKFVEVVARSRYRVTPILLKDTRDLFALRTLLEGEAAALAAAHLADTSHLEALESLCQETYIPHDNKSIIAFLEHNTRFHLTIAAASGNHRLTDTLAGLLEHMERLFYIGLKLMPRPQDMAHEHTGLVRAIVRGDPVAAREEAIMQCRASQQMVIEALVGSQAFDAVNIWSDATESLVNAGKVR